MSSQMFLSSVQHPSLQRRCACGKNTDGGECEECRKKGQALQRKPARDSAPSQVPPIVYDVLRSPGAPLDVATRSMMERRFGHRFDGVRLHAGAKAAESAREVEAAAYTVGQNIVFSNGAYAPQTPDGRNLLTHELAHVVQQKNVVSNDGPIELPNPQSAPARSLENQAERAADVIASGQNAGMAHWSGRSPVLLKAEKLGTRVTDPPKTKSAFTRMHAEFDGRDFILFGDKTEILRAPGQSGRPYAVSAADAKSCHGSTNDSYMNNSRYVGIADNGPIPEGTYEFAHTDFTTFTANEQRKMSLANEGAYVDPSGLSLHGDWGAARAALKPRALKPAKECGNTSKRSGFYLHGGIMPGSSGCIDIGNDAITKVVTLTAGFTSAIPLKVEYRFPPPNVGAMNRAAGRFMYPGQKNPSLVDRVKSLFGGGD